MPEKNLRIKKRLERFNLLVDRSIAELRGINVKARRVREKKAVKWYHFPKQVRRPSTNSTSRNTSSLKHVKSAYHNPTAPTTTASGPSPSPAHTRNRLICSLPPRLLLRPRSYHHPALSLSGVEMPNPAPSGSL